MSISQIQHYDIEEEYTPKVKYAFLGKITLSLKHQCFCKTIYLVHKLHIYNLNKCSALGCLCKHHYKEVCSHI